MARHQRSRCLSQGAGFHIQAQFGQQEGHTFGLGDRLGGHQDGLPAGMADRHLVGCRGVPLLGVCRGVQVLNVALGGTLEAGPPSTGVGWRVTATLPYEAQ